MLWCMDRWVVGRGFGAGIRPIGFLRGMQLGLGAACRSRLAPGLGGGAGIVSSLDGVGFVGPWTLLLGQGPFN